MARPTAYAWCCLPLFASCSAANVSAPGGGDGGPVTHSTPALTGTQPASPANHNAPLVLGTAEAGVEVGVFSDTSCATLLASGESDGAGAWTIAISVADDSTTAVYAAVLEGGAVASPCAGPLTYIEDSTPPGPPVDVSIDPAGPANDNAPVISGVIDADATVTVFLDAACTDSTGVSGDAAELAAGLALSVADDTTSDFYLAVTDAAGNTRCAATPTSYVEDSTPPGVPVLESTEPASPSESETVVVHGTTDPDVVVSVYAGADCDSLLDSGTADAGGAFAISVTVPLDAATVLTAMATDAASNPSGCSDGIEYRQVNPPRFTNLPAAIGCDPGGELSFTVTATDSPTDLGLLVFSDVGSDCDFAYAVNGASGALTGTCGSLGGECTITVRVSDGVWTVSSQLTVSINGEIWYVAESGAGLEDGTSWDNAFAGLNSALTAAQAGDQIWVAEGTYKATAANAPVLAAADGVAIYGGFAGDESTLTDRGMPLARPTVLSGDFAGDDPGSTSDNSYHVVWMGGGVARIDGFSITGGNASAPSGDDAEGGGLRIAGGTLFLANALVEGNRSTADGGGMYNYLGTQVSLARVTFSRNSTGPAGSGGGWLADGSVEGSEVQLLDNAAGADGSGGGFYQGGGSLRLRDSRIEGNAAYRGGGAALVATSSLFNTLVRGNASQSLAGGLYIGADATLVNTVVSGNAAVVGGGLYVDPGAVRIFNATIRANQASVSGGGLYDAGNSTTVANTLLWQNQAPVSPELHPAGSSFAISHSAAAVALGGDNVLLGEDESFVEAASGQFLLDEGNHCLDAGDDAAADVGFTLFDQDWRQLTTRPSQALDVVQVDIGAHYRPGPFILSLSSDRAAAISGEPLTFSWWTTGAESCTIGPPGTNIDPAALASGSLALTVAPRATYTMSCSGAGQTVEASLYVGAVWFVTEGGGGAQDGTSWDNAFAMVQAGLDAAIAGDEVWVARGTYTAGEYTPVATLKPFVPIYGGFEGGELSVGVRPADASVLDGANSSYHVVVGASNTTLDGFTLTRGRAKSDSSGDRYGGGLYAPNVSSFIARNLIVSSNSTTNGGCAGAYVVSIGDVSLSSLSFVGNATSANVGDDGGGVCLRGTGFSLTDSSFSGNEAQQGGGLMADGQGIVARVTFTSNRSLQQSVGGGAALLSGSPLVLEHLTINNNETASNGEGGGIRVANGTVTVSDSTFTGNGYLGLRASAGTLSVARTLFTGHSRHGLWVDHSATVNIVDCDFISNGSDTTGGGMYTFGTTTVTNSRFIRNRAGTGGAISLHAGTLSLLDVRLEENTASSGGGLYIDGGVPTLTRVQLIGNTAVGGGGLYHNGGYAADMDFTDVLFSHNRATGQPGGGGAVLKNCTTPSVVFSRAVFEHNQSAWNGGALLANGVAVHFLDSHLVSNKATNNGGAISAESSNPGFPAAPVLYNSVVIGNTAGVKGGAFYTNGTASVVLFQDLVRDNSSPSGSVVYNSQNCRTTITNSVVFNGDATKVAVDETGALTTIDHSCVEGGWSGAGTATDALLTSDPIAATTVDGKYLLASGTPCEDIGDDSAAAAVYPEGWSALTDQVDSTLDTVQVDAGLHYVPGPFILRFAATPAAATVGGTATLSWETRGADSCTLTPDFGDLGSGELASGTRAFTVASRGLIYTLACTGQGESAIATTRIGAVWFVDAAATGGDGFSWASALKTVVSAASQAVSGDAVWLKAGTHAVASGVRLGRGMTLAGGFEGDELAIEDRPATLPATTLDGQGTACHVVIGASGAHLDGLIIANGNATDACDQPRGAGLLLDRVLEFSGEDVAFVNNTATSAGATPACGAAVYANSGEASFEDVSFSGNSAAGSLYGCAGAILLSGGSMSLANAAFDTNSATAGSDVAYGGAVYATSAALRLRDARFTNNSASSSSQAAFGGALGCYSGTLDIAGAVFEGNSVGDDGWGGAIQAGSCSSTLASVAFKGNSAGGGASYGGAVAVIDGTTEIINSSFLDNEMTGQVGGAIACYQSSGAAMHVSSSSFANNTKGGVTPRAGAIGNWGCTMDVVNSVFFGNTAPEIWDASVATAVDHSAFAGASSPNINLTANPFERLDLDGDAVDELYLATGGVCVDAGDDSTADADFGAVGLDWTQMTTQSAGGDDAPAVDLGRHY